MSCRGVSCNQETRCDVCSLWPEGMMTAYLTHQISLEKKRKSKKKLKESNSQVADFTTLCTGLQEADVVQSDDGLLCGGGGDSVSSVAMSALSQNVESLVSVKFSVLSQDLRSNLNLDMQNKLDTFGQNMFDLVNSIREENKRSWNRSRNSSSDDNVDDNTNFSFPAPRQVSGQRPIIHISSIFGFKA